MVFFRRVRYSTKILLGINEMVNKNKIESILAVFIFEMYTRKGNESYGE